MDGAKVPLEQDKGHGAGAVILALIETSGLLAAQSCDELAPANGLRGADAAGAEISRLIAWWHAMRAYTVEPVARRDPREQHFAPSMKD